MSTEQQPRDFALYVLPLMEALGQCCALLARTDLVTVRLKIRTSGDGCSTTSFGWRKGMSRTIRTNALRCEALETRLLLTSEGVPSNAQDELITGDNTMAYATGRPEQNVIGENTEGDLTDDLHQVSRTDVVRELDNGDDGVLNRMQIISDLQNAIIPHVDSDGTAADSVVEIGGHTLEIRKFQPERGREGVAGNPKTFDVGLRHRSSDGHRLPHNVNYTIDWGDGTAVTRGGTQEREFEANHTWATPGVYFVTLTVTDAAHAGLTDEVTRRVVIKRAKGDTAPWVDAYANPNGDIKPLGTTVGTGQRGRKDRVEVPYGVNWEGLQRGTSPTVTITVTITYNNGQQATGTDSFRTNSPGVRRRTITVCAENVQTNIDIRSISVTVTGSGTAPDNSPVNDQNAGNGNQTLP